MKWKKVAVLLSISLVLSGNTVLLANAEDNMVFDDGTESLKEVQENSLQDEEQIELEPFEQNETEQSNGDVIEDFQQEINDAGNGEDIFSSGEENEGDFTENMDDVQGNTAERDTKYNLKYSVGTIEKSDIFVGEDVEKNLSVKWSIEESAQQLEKSNYTVMGYITEEQLNQADCDLDNLNEFKTLPDTVGKWYLIFEGVSPYYGRQAVCVTVHDQYDLSMYKWRMDREVIVGENPEESLEIFMDNDENHLVGKENYTILGYITQEEYIAANYNLEKITDFTEKIETSGNWLLVVEGKGQYHGRQAGWVSVKDQYDINMYQIQLTTDKVTPGEDISKYIEISNVRYGDEKVLDETVYRVTGYIKENDFIANGYDVNKIENLQKSADSSGGWYAVVEGIAPYYGKSAVWIEVDELDTTEEIGMKQ